MNLLTPKQILSLWTRIHDRCYSKDYSGYKYIGDSDTAIPLLNINALYPDSPVVIVRRDKHEVVESLGKLYGDNDYLPVLVRYMEQGIQRLQSKLDSAKAIDN